MRGDGRISLWEEEQGRARDGRRRRWITGYCCCPPCRWIRPCSSFPSTAPRCWPRLGEAACARLCGPDPSPPRNWRSCAGEKSHGWLREKKREKRTAVTNWARAKSKHKQTYHKWSRQMSGLFYKLDTWWYIYIKRYTHTHVWVIFHFKIIFCSLQFCSLWKKFKNTIYSLQYLKI